MLELCPNEKTVDEGRFFDVHGCGGTDKASQPYPVMGTHLDYFHRDPVPVNPSDFRQLDVDNCLLVFQPELDFHKFPYSQVLRGGELTPSLDVFEDAPVRFKLTADVGEHAVNRKLRTFPPDLFFSPSHNVIRRVVSERVAWLYLKSGRVYPEWQ